jgi:hypothetical protein
MAIDWADDVEEAIENGELPDYAPKTEVIRTTHEIPPEAIVRYSTSTMKKPVPNERDLDWKNKKSWRATTEPLMPEPESTRSSGTTTTVLDERASKEGASQDCTAQDGGDGEIVHKVQSVESESAPSEIFSDYCTAREGTIGSYHTSLESPETPVADMRIASNIERIENFKENIRSQLQQSMILVENITKTVGDTLQQSSTDGKYYNSDRDVSQRPQTLPYISTPLNIYREALRNGQRGSPVRRMLLRGLSKKTPESNFHQWRQTLFFKPLSPDMITKKFESRITQSRP